MKRLQYRITIRFMWSIGVGRMLIESTTPDWKIRGIPAQVHEGFTNENFLFMLVISLLVPLKRPLFQQFGETDNYYIRKNFSHTVLLRDATIIQK